MMENEFTSDNDRLIVITGGNSGIGFAAAKKFANENFRIILAVRNKEKGAYAKARILESFPDAKIEIMHLDLSDLESVRNFSGELHERHSRLDVLCNNAGIMWSPRALSKQGYEMHFATNHLGHFLLTGLVTDLLKKSSGSRVITTTSIARFGYSFNDLQNYSRGLNYNRYVAYSNSKMMNFLFSHELSKFFENKKCNSMSISVHPGISRTKLFISASKSDKSLLRKLLHAASGLIISQPASWGAMPTIRAAIDRRVENGDLISPLVFGIWGSPLKKRIHLSKDMERFSKKLWEFSENCCDFKYSFS